MQTAFLIIIALLGTVYALTTRQTKTAAGLFIITLAFVLQIPDLVTGFWVDILLALSLMFFTVGVGVVVWKKKNKDTLEIVDAKTPDNDKK